MTRTPEQREHLLKLLNDFAYASSWASEPKIGKAAREDWFYKADALVAEILRMYDEPCN